MTSYPEFILCFFGVIGAFNLAVQLNLGFQESLVAAVLPEFKVLFIVYTGIDSQKWRKITGRYRAPRSKVGEMFTCLTSSFVSHFTKERITENTREVHGELGLI